jgi:cystathionine beta-lyase
MEEIIDKFIDREYTNAEKYTLRKELFGTDDVLPMWVADMDLATPEFILDAISQRLNHPVLGYEEPQDEVKNSFKDWIYNNHNISTQLDDIFLASSVVTTINVAIQAFTKEEDEIIVQTPVYFPFFKSVLQNKRKLVKNSLILDHENRYQIDFDGLESLITKKTKMIIICSPHNPVGRVWSPEELQKLYNICKKNDIIIFEDAIHSDLVYKPNNFISLFNISQDDENDLILSSFGIGKTFNCAGLNMSAVLIKNKSLQKKYLDFTKSSQLNTPNILSTTAFYTAYTKGQEWLEKLLEHFDNNITILENRLLKYHDLIEFEKPQATYLVWLNCKNMNMSDKHLREFFITRAKLGLNPGISFGKEGSGFMRINIAVDSQTLHRACDQLCGALDELLISKNI